MRSIVFIIAAMFCFQGIALAEDLVNDQTSTVMPATSRKKKLKSSWKSVQEEVKAAENEAASDTTDTITAVTSSDGTTVREVSSDGSSITTRETAVNGQGSNSYTLNLKTGTITLGAANGTSAVITKESAPEAYEIALAQMAGTISEVQARKVLSASEAAFLNDIQKTLSGYKTGTIFEVTSGNGLVQVTVRNDGTTITTDYTAISAKTWPYHLNLATGTITYIPYPYSQDDTAKQVTLTKASNPEEYKKTIQNMIDDVDHALNNSGASALTESQVQFLNRIKTELAAYRDGTALPPARPGDTVTDPAVWQKYYEDYAAYINDLAPAAKQAAWEALGADIRQLSKTHPELITAQAMAKVLGSITQELKTKWRNQDDTYKNIDFTKAQTDILAAALNFVKSDTFKSMGDGNKDLVVLNFTHFGVELSWRSAFNETNSVLYPRISQFYQIVLENSSTNVKAFAFTQLLHLFRTDNWGSPEGNRAVAQQLLKEALVIPGGLKGLMEEFSANINNTGLDVNIRAWIACAVADLVWHQKDLNAAVGSELITDAVAASATKLLSGFLSQVNSGSAAISAHLRNNLMHHAGSALNTLVAADKKDTKYAQGLAEEYIGFAQDNYLLSAEDGGNESLQSTVINCLKSIKNHYAAKNDASMVMLCDLVLMEGSFDVNAFLMAARENIKKNGGADHEAWVARAMADIITLHLQKNANDISDEAIKAVVSDIRDWVTDSNNLLDMRQMQYQRRLYEVLAELVTEFANTRPGLLEDQQVAGDFLDIFATIPGLRDSLVKELAAKAVTDAAVKLRDKDFDAFANKLEISLCPDSASLMTKAWEYYTANDYNTAKAFANECISRYSEEALEQQASLKDFAPKGKEADYWALNDVGTAHFVLGEIYKARKNYDKAKEEYNTVISQLGFAQCYDPANKSYWKVAAGAKKSLAEIGSKVEFWTMTPQEAARYLAALGTEQAAIELKGFLDSGDGFTANVGVAVAIAAEMGPVKLVAVLTELDKLGDYLTDAGRIQAFANALTALEPVKAAKVLVATRAGQTLAVLKAMKNDDIAAILEAVSAMEQNSYTQEFTQKIKDGLAGVSAERLANIVASDKMRVATAVKLLKSLKVSDAVKLDAVLTKLDTIAPERASRIREALDTNITGWDIDAKLEWYANVGSAVITTTGDVMELTVQLPASYKYIFVYNMTTKQINWDSGSMTGVAKKSDANYQSKFNWMTGYLNNAYGFAVEPVEKAQLLEVLDYLKTETGAQWWTGNGTFIQSAVNGLPDIIQQSDLSKTAMSFTKDSSVTLPDNTVIQFASYLEQGVTYNTIIRTVDGRSIESALRKVGDHYEIYGTVEVFVPTFSFNPYGEKSWHYTSYLISSSGQVIINM
ncbi:MAG: hypothetical protein PHE65_01300 [Candidatus Omnitrophica bacterium]|nr:hypothetical protein [Candidatus Omnitrophota bacterium]